MNLSENCTIKYVRNNFECNTCTCRKAINFKSRKANLHYCEPSILQHCQNYCHAILFISILNQIPNATSKTFLNNSKSTKYITMSFKLWLDKCMYHFMIEFERPVKTQIEKNLINLDLLYLNVLFLCIYGHFTTFKWLKVFKLSKICLKMIRAMTPKTTAQNICFLKERIRFNLQCWFNDLQCRFNDLQCRFNEGGIKIQILINTHLRKMHVRYIRRFWLAKHKISVRRSDWSCIYRAQICTNLA